ncbi:hypothetical protein PMIT1327_01383 [Prochlorococcus marinus str. MIT 1327]|nr:hypothetical protein PMIT1312_02048 [Prochlorococcus marinus str. MIT 1312]KZR80935.1 hypothetical protein PMIT1327_01383 [Prochlorococcus marinus str. MIT 1327]
MPSDLYLLIQENNAFSSASTAPQKIDEAENNEAAAKSNLCTGPVIDAFKQYKHLTAKVLLLIHFYIYLDILTNLLLILLKQEVKDE